MILAYIFISGPVLLYASRGINDSLRMKLEMEIMIYGYMITTPFCIIAQATNAFNSISVLFPPFMWFAPVLMLVSYYTSSHDYTRQSKVLFLDKLQS